MKYPLEKNFEMINSASIIEDYFYDEELKKEIYKTFVDYIDSNIEQFVKK